MSMGIDVLPIADTNGETARLADDIEGVAGELSPFEEMHGFSIDGVDVDTAVLPNGMARPPREGPERQHGRADRGSALHRVAPRREDLCVAKLCALREKDRYSVAALLDAGLVDADVVLRRLHDLPAEQATAVERAVSWLG